MWGKELFFDASKVAANADLDSLAQRLYQEAKTHIADLFAEAMPMDDTRGRHYEHAPNPHADRSLRGALGLGRP
jgi:hypothetical protein